MIPFTLGEKYSRKDVREIMNVPGESKRGGNWDTGYTRFNDDYFVFVNVGSAGRTGHDYDNEFVNGNLHWYAKTNTNIRQDEIKRLLNPTGNIYIFTREDNKDVNFVYQGTGHVKECFDETPVKIIWEFKDVKAIVGE